MPSEPHKRPAIFLDRDGVLNFPLLKNGKPFPPSTIQEFKLMPGVEEAINAFVEANFLLIVVTNQPDPLRGTQKREIVEEMHVLLKKWLPLDDILTAWDETSHEYKPSIGLVTKAVEKHHINLTKSFFIGDRWRDIECGKRAGCSTVFIDNKYKEALTVEPDIRCQSLREAAQLICHKQTK